MSLRSRIFTFRAVFLGGFAACLAVSFNVSGASFTVSNTSDSGAGSLRQALIDNNASSDVTNTISFFILGIPPFTIAPTSALPSITQPVTIDATTQLGFLGTPVIELNGAGAGSASPGFFIATSNCTIRGFVINRFLEDGIRIQGLPGNLIAGNFIGTDVTGQNPLGNAQGGITILTSGNTVGGISVADRNVISGSNLAGIFLENNTANNNVILGNYIGIDVTGAHVLGNTNGIVVSGGVSNIIGGTVAGAGNVISGNYQSGIYMINSGTGGANGNVIQGNYVGPNASGTGALPNGSVGITILSSASNTIGGTNAGAGNLISGNLSSGIIISGTSASNNLVQGCLIGTAASGRASLPNSTNGVEILNASFNQIGGTNALARNVISGNHLGGVDIEDTRASGNAVWGNYIGVDITGTNAMGNWANGVFILTVTNNFIGGSLPGQGNVISGSGANGVYITGAGAQANVVAGNMIGVDATGLKGVGNLLSGVRIESPGNVIGGTAAGARNIISGNSNNAEIFLTGSAASNNVIEGCYVGTDVTGTNAYLGVAYTNLGVYLQNAPNNLIGGTAAGAGNLISGNMLNGIFLNNSSGNVIQGNFIGTDPTGMKAVANGTALPVTDSAGGIDLSGNGNLVGGTLPSAGNIISGNYRDGICLSFASSNLIQGNLIGTAADGVSPLGNEWAGVEMINAGNAANNVVGGITSAAFNVIMYANFGVVSNAGRSGVRIRSYNTLTFLYNGNTNNQVLGNSIYLNGNLGIDSGALGVTTNSLNNSGPPAVRTYDQNYPVLSNVLSANGVTLIQGTLNSTPSGTYFIQFYDSATPNASAPFGQGQTYLGSTNVTTDGSGNASINAVLPVGVAAGKIVTSTAFWTTGFRDTSEFSQDTTSQAAQVPGIASLQPASTNVPYGSNATFSVTATGTGPLSYQWLFNNTNISGANGSTLTVSNVQPLNAGNYSVQVSSIFGSANSAPAALTVLVNPVPIQAVMANGFFTLAWPTNGPVLTLQQTPALNNPQVWSDSTNPTGVSGNQFVVTIPPVQTNQFYRLILEP